METASRWDSDQSHLVQTTDLLGDHLAMELRRAIQAREGEVVLARYRDVLRKKLLAYENEPRLLLKLADTGRVVQELEKAIRTVLSILRLQTLGVVASWLQHLEYERQQRVKQYEVLLADKNHLGAELGDEQSHEEIQTLLKHGIEKYGAVLTPGELGVITSVFKASVDLSGIIVVRIPDWFATTSDGGDVETTALAGGEERCLREASLWSKLRHPNVRKFYAACHVGKEAYILHEVAYKPGYEDWGTMVGYAHGLRFLHELGIVHKELSRENFMYSPGGGYILSGLGLAYAPPAEGMPDGSSEEVATTNRYANVTADDQCPSKARDVKTFSTCCFKILVSGRTGSLLAGPGPEPKDFPSKKPRILHNEEWRLLQSMRCVNPADRVSILDVVQQLEALARGERSNDPDDIPEPVENVRDYVVATLGQTLAEILEEAALTCAEADDELAAVHQPVCDRLWFVYEQLKRCSLPLSLQMVEAFGEIVQRFFLTLERKTSGGFSCGVGSSQSVVGPLCASRTVAGRNYGLHHDIDSFLREYASLGLDISDTVHIWKPSWEAVQHKQRQKLESMIEDPSRILEDIESEAERSEALALLQYECQNAGLLGVGQLLSALPPWYIAPHRVQLGKHLADGSFGSVYEGSYEETPVVVKVLSRKLTSGTRRQFMQEADVWFLLEHRHVLKLYGACHEGHPFFVCEPAILGTIVEATKRVGYVWGFLRQVGEGLQYLHDHGIVHADLKGNNILVTGVMQPKLADFGLSFDVHSSTSMTAADNGALGAFRWKAPEVLRGEKATLASDIYSFGMCIIEAVTGEFPWGNNIPDAVVKHNVVHERLLPLRPVNFRDEEWDLVTRMCCYDPDDRLTIGAVLAFFR